jgi:hypothetical protein
VIPLAEAAAAAFPRLDLTDDEARRLAQGARLPVRAPLPAGSHPAGSPPAASRPPGSLAPSSASIKANGTEEQVNERDPIAAFAPDGTLVALVTVDGGQIRSLAVFADLIPAPPRDLGPLRLKNLLQHPFDLGRGLVACPAAGRPWPARFSGQVRVLARAPGQIWYEVLQHNHLKPTRFAHQDRPTCHDISSSTKA